MQSRDQTRAMLAHTHIMTVAGWKDERRAKKYGSMVHRLPALIRSAGLSQALHFVKSRKSKDQNLLLQHLADQLRVMDGTIAGPQELLDVVRKAPLPKYLSFTREALACIDWYRRLVQGELDVEAGDRDDDDR